MKTRAFVSHYVAKDEDPNYNLDFFCINANGNEIGDLTLEQLKNIYDLIGKNLAEQSLKS